jgi:hypothetical protein
MAVTRMRISARARELFRQMQAADTSEAWWALHSQLHDELGLPPWVWPCVIGPNDEMTIQSGTFAAKCDVQARALYDALAIRDQKNVL